MPAATTNSRSSSRARRGALVVITMVRVDQVETAVVNDRRAPGLVSMQDDPS